MMTYVDIDFGTARRSHDVAAGDDDGDHAVTAVFAGRTIASFIGHLADDGISAGIMSDILVEAVCSDRSIPCAAFDVHALSVAFDTAYVRCQTLTGNCACGRATTGQVAVTVSRLPVRTFPQSAMMAQ